MKSKGEKKKKTKTSKKVVGEITKEKETKEGKNKSIFIEKKKQLIALFLGIIIIIAVGYLYFSQGRNEIPIDPVNMSISKDLGVVTIWGDGLPGYDIDRDGKADYINSGFGYYKEVYDSGGFEFGPAGILLEDFEVDIQLPKMKFFPEEIVESSVGSVVIFSASDPSTDISSRVILKTLGPALTTYSVFFDHVDGESYSVIDIIEEDGGTIEQKEVEQAGRLIIRE